MFGHISMPWEYRISDTACFFEVIICLRLTRVGCPNGLVVSLVIFIVNPLLVVERNVKSIHDTNEKSHHYELIWFGWQLSGFAQPNHQISIRLYHQLILACLQNQTPKSGE